MVCHKVIALALLLGVAVHVGYRWFARSAHEAGAELRADHELPQNSAGRLERDLGALEYDPASGVYRPVRRAA